MSAESTRRVRWVIAGSFSIAFVAFLGCGDDSDGSKDENTEGGAGRGGAGASTPREACLGYCAAYTEKCGAQDCAAYCDGQATHRDCVDALAQYHRCGTAGPFRCEVPIGLTPLACGLDAYVTCQADTRDVCSRHDAIDALCTSGHGASFQGYLCTVADAPAGCVKSNPDNTVATQSMCCPAP